MAYPVTKYGQKYTFLYKRPLCWKKLNYYDLEITHKCKENEVTENSGKIAIDSIKLPDIWLSM